MRMPHRSCPWLCPALVAAAFTLLAAAGTATAQAYPQRAVRIIVPYPAGAGTDIATRMLAQRISDGWGQAMVVENRPGAGAIVGVDAVAKAVPDGYTIGIGDMGPLAINQALYAKLPYDTLRDLAPVVELANLPFVLVAHPSLGVTTVAELLALARRRPGQINYASGGNGTASHLAAELLKKQAGIDLVHIPYKGQPPALTDVLAGTTQVMFLNLLTGLQHVKSGRLRALAVATPRRIATLAEMPTLAEAGVPGYDFQLWFGVIAPAGTAAPIVERLNAEFRRVLALPEIRERLQKEGGMEPAGGSAAQFGALIASEQERWGRLVKETGARVD
ncbi:MAG: tripartite tricarboxylate transporter substrate binding protein [Burkholderiales bacterium]